jgi:hypothetical protein
MRVSLEPLKLSVKLSERVIGKNVLPTRLRMVQNGLEKVAEEVLP